MTWPSACVGCAPLSQPGKWELHRCVGEHEVGILVPAAPSKRYQPFGPLSQTVFCCCKLPFCLSPSDSGNFDFLKKCESMKIYERRNEKELKTESTRKTKTKKNKTRKLKREVSKWNVGHILNICLKICSLVHYVYVILWCNSFSGCHSGIHVDKKIMFSAILTIQAKPITDHFMTNG